MTAISKNAATIRLVGKAHAMAETVIREGMCNVDEVWGVEVPMYFPGIMLVPLTVLVYTQAAKQLWTLSKQQA